MKRFSFLMIAFFLTFSLTAQDIEGKWNGELNISGSKLRLAFDIINTDQGLSTTMYSLDQSGKGIPTTQTSFENSKLEILIANAAIQYEGTLGNDNIIVGTFTQAGQSRPLNLSKGNVEKMKLVRPQEPTKPFPYHSEDVTFENKEAGISLAGTLTLPKKEGIFPVVILISGSGAQNRDEEIFGHKPFLVLSDYLTKNGIGVLRYDDRGTALSTGNFNSATSADFATDVESAITYLQTRNEVDPKSIGLVGHSEGGMIASMVASKSSDVAFMVSLAGTGLRGGETILLQQKLIARASGVGEEILEQNELLNREAFNIINESTSSEQLRADLATFFKKSLRDSPLVQKPEGISEEDFVEMQIRNLISPWMQYYIKYDPASALEKVKCPVLAINGEKDLQVPPKEHLSAIETALSRGGNKNVTIKELPNLNHLFQESTTGSLDEYAKIEQTFSPDAMAVIFEWINNQVN